MKPEELRIGNYVTINNEKAYSGLKGIPFKIVGINKKERYSIQLSNNEYYEYNQFIEFIQPIKLTKKLLLKCGFIENENYEFPSFDEYIHKDYKWFGIGEFNGKYYIINFMDLSKIHKNENKLLFHHLNTK